MRKLSKYKPTEKKVPAGDFGDHYRRGSQLLHEGRHQEAIPLLEKAQTLEPTHFQANLNLSGAYILSGRFKQAIPILEQLSQAEPENVMVWTNLGAAYLGNPVLAGDKEQEKAIAAFHTALRLNPIGPNIAYNLGLIYRDRQETERAIYWFEQALAADPDDDDARRILARLQTQANDHPAL